MMMKYIFYVAKIYSIPVIRPLVDYLVEGASDDFVFYVSDKVKNHFPDAWDRGRIIDGLDAAKAFNPDFVLCPGNFVDFRIPGIKVQLFHGLGVEKASHYQIRHFFDVYLTSGPACREDSDPRRAWIVSSNSRRHRSVGGWRAPGDTRP